MHCQRHKRHLRKILVLSIGLFYISASDIKAKDQPYFTDSTCAAQLDAFVNLFEHEALHTEKNQLKEFNHFLTQLEQRCPHFPQIAHNLGVIAALKQQWTNADRHFKRAINMDSRVAITFGHLQAIHEYQAALAYSDALGINTDLKPPSFSLQKSGLVYPASRPDSSQLRDRQTIEYELFAWWQAMQTNHELFDYYTEEVSPQQIDKSRKKFLGKQWQEIKREVAFTEHDVVVILSDGLKNQTLLLLRLDGSRWKIYQEIAL